MAPSLLDKILNELRKKQSRYGVLAQDGDRYLSEFQM